MSPDSIEADPFGLSARFIRMKDGRTHHASSPARLLTGEREAVDPEGLLDFLCFSYILSPRTIYSAIRRIPPGATVDSGPGEIPTWTATWRESAPSDAPEPVLVAQARELLRAAVRRCVGDRAEVGVFLSGGLDSSLVAALLQEAGVRIECFTLDFGPPWNQELTYARQVAGHLQRPLHVVPAGAGEIGKAIEATAAALELPYGDPVTVPLYLLSRAASDRCSMICNGEGGDQLFGGWANKPMIAAEAYGDSRYDRLDAYMETFHRFWGRTRELLTPEALAAIGDYDPRSTVATALAAPGCSSLLHRLRAANLALKGAHNIAPRAGQLGAACGLQVRCPFFDRELTQWSFSLPPEVFLRGACEKYLLKLLARDYLPEEIVRREKRGMGVPATEWLLGPLQGRVAERLSRRRLRRDGWFQHAAVDSLLKGEDRPGEFRTRRLGEKLWLLYTLHVWLDEHHLSL